MSIKRIKQPNGTIRFIDELGRSHRENGPAVIMRNGTIMYFKHGVLHREDGPAVLNINQKKISWYKDGKLHREDGPAFLGSNWHSGLTQITFFIEGKKHRLDGPAEIEKLQNITVKEYYIKGERLQHDNKVVDLINIKYYRKTSEEKELLDFHKELVYYLKEAKDVIKNLLC